MATYPPGRPGARVPAGVSIIGGPNSGARRIRLGVGGRGPDPKGRDPPSDTGCAAIVVVCIARGRGVVTVDAPRILSSAQDGARAARPIAAAAAPPPGDSCRSVPIPCSNLTSVPLALLARSRGPERRKVGQVAPYPSLAAELHEQIDPPISTRTDGLPDSAVWGKLQTGGHLKGCSVAVWRDYAWETAVL